uniref:Microfibril associated protein 2 n=1 Tax=Paramormyrops kingsleyae TaxID=1676925 RepID=A0A3B3RCM6_9TELE
MANFFFLSFFLTVRLSASLSLSVCLSLSLSPSLPPTNTVLRPMCLPPQPPFSSVDPNGSPRQVLPSPQQQQQQVLQQISGPSQSEDAQTEPTEPGPLDCREEQYPCTRLYSVHKPCRQCLNSLCFYSLRRVYVVNKEVCVRTVCAHEELLRADLCRDQFPRCGVAALTGQCGALGSSCGKSCGGC